ncbi:unnamed protein product [Staurois parvus]|uniref:Olfactory receptor n=1 Tax=Staurois parvus TaxID=386267 RepID=A0ABN9G343_9NEOB|nr:unnamed protein product [Staurois parvus]
MIYILTICGNLSMVILVAYSKILHSPMYFFLVQLSLCDIMLTTDIVPILCHTVLYQTVSISFITCIAQYCIFVISECCEGLLLTVMSYDRYLAICMPLHYASIMNSMFCMKLAMIPWLLSVCTMVVTTTSIAFLQFCGPNIIDHFFCDVSPLLKLSCSDVSLVQTELVFLSVPVLFLPFLFILFSYTNVIATILKIPSITGKQKAFSTCSSHLMVVFLYYITLICMYDLPASGQPLNMGQSSHLAKTLSLLYTVGTPLMNPIIYSLRNKDIKKALEKLISTNIFMF